MLPAMCSRVVFDPKPRRPRRCDTKARPDPTDTRVDADPPKVCVMGHICQLIANGYADWDVLDSRDIRLSFNTGQTFLLAERAIVRLA
jgi:hypothetical protein